MTEQKLFDLIVKISQKTGATKNALCWEKTVSEEEFQTTLSNFVVRIRREDDDYILSIVNKDGVAIESINSQAIVKAAREHPFTFTTHNPLTQMTSFQADENARNIYSLIETLFKNAKRKALGVDQIIDTIMLELN